MNFNQKLTSKQIGFSIICFVITATFFAYKWYGLTLCAIILTIFVLIKEIKPVKEYLSIMRDDDVKIENHSWKEFKFMYILINFVQISYTIYLFYFIIKLSFLDPSVIFMEDDIEIIVAEAVNACKPLYYVSLSL